MKEINRMKIPKSLINPYCQFVLCQLAGEFALLFVEHYFFTNILNSSELRSLFLLLKIKHV
jgi:hypothetical protein